MSAGVSVIIEDLKKHPRCPHGPTLLFRTMDNNKLRNFYGCSACRDRKQCSIFVWQDEMQTYRKAYWDSQIAKYVAASNPRTVYQTFMDVLQTCEAERMYCHDCGEFELPKYQQRHLQHKHVKCIKEEELKCPSKLLLPLDDAKKEAQYLFAENSCTFIVNTIMKLNYKYVLCIGAPRIHEYILNNCLLKLDSFLMDFDKRYMAFNNPMQFAWYNVFNHHFFVDGDKENYADFLSSNKGNELIIVTDPPFGGRIEPLAATLEIINKEHQTVTKLTEKLPVFFVFPYFMEPQILNNMKDFSMLDYKVGYDNHSLFSEGPKARKQGSPVRIFTNIKLALIELPESEGYKFCKKCERWVSEENKHCNKCQNCTAKDGREYEHCNICKRCVKNSWSHCEKCKKCASSDHKCEEIAFKHECFHCKQEGHKKENCPLLRRTGVHDKKKTNTTENKSIIDNTFNNSFVDTEAPTQRKQRKINKKRTKSQSDDGNKKKVLVKKIKLKEHTDANVQNGSIEKMQQGKLNQEKGNFRKDKKQSRQNQSIGKPTKNKMKPNK